MCVDDKKTTSLDGSGQSPFWVFPGGGIEPGEDLKEAAIRELYEETGCSRDDVEFGPIVWRSEVHMVLAGTPSHIKDQYIVAKLKRDIDKISTKNFTDWEKEVVKTIGWLSLEQIKNISDPVYPTGLVNYLPNILEGKYPEEPILLYKKR